MNEMRRDEMPEERSRLSYMRDGSVVVVGLDQPAARLEYWDWRTGTVVLVVPHYSRALGSRSSLLGSLSAPAQRVVFQLRADGWFRRLATYNVRAERGQTREV